jgi:hypothetical protein
MAILQLTLALTHDELNQRAYGSAAPTNGVGDTVLNRYINNYGDTVLNSYINNYLQSLTHRVTSLLRQRREIGPDERIGLEMWRTDGSLTETEASSTVHFPVDYDHYISFWDRTHGRKINPIENVDKYWRSKFLDRNDTDRTGPTEWIEIQGFVDNRNIWQRTGQLWPRVVAGVTPDIQLTYYRLPAIVSVDADEPDIDIKYQNLLIYGPIQELLRDNRPSYERYVERERELLLGLAATAKSI